MEKVRKELVGKVVSAKNNKTITVLVETYKKDPLYGKRVKALRNMLFMMKEIKLKLEILFVSLKLVHYQKQNISI